MSDTTRVQVEPPVVTTAPAPSRWWLLALPFSALFSASAVTLEVAAGRRANSDAPSWGHLVPLAWSPTARVVWWLAVAAAALVFRVGLRKLGMPTNRSVDVLTVAPFVAFAAGIAVGADWGTWH